MIAVGAREHGVSGCNHDCRDASWWSPEARAGKAKSAVLGWIGLGFAAMAVGSGVGPSRPPTRADFAATSQGDVIPVSRLLGDVGLSRELRVAEMVGGRLAKTGKKLKDVVLRSPTGEGVKVDVFGPKGELIVVGGPGKNPAELGDKLRVLRETADARGLQAHAYFEEGTSQRLLDIAANWLGINNVGVFPR